MYVSFFLFVCCFWACVFCMCECEHRFVDVGQRKEEKEKGETSWPVFFLWERKKRAKTGFSERENRERKLIFFLRVCREQKQKIEREKQKSKEWEQEEECSTKVQKWRQRPTRGCSWYQRTTIEQHLSCLLVSGYFVLCFSSFFFIWFSIHTQLGEEL